ncbi:MAG: MoaD/ThiS family protein [Phycisphaerales bacterium]|nr:MoaD/ThiS family protein [Phycisphaerales bacterium]
MAIVEIQLPSVLAAVTDGNMQFSVEAQTLRDALDVIVRQHPRLALHFFNEEGVFRPHVLCFLNETNTRWLDDLEVPLNGGDTLRFMQAVSGG